MQEPRKRGTSRRQFLKYAGQTPGCRNEFASYAHGAKGSEAISSSGHTPVKVREYKGRNMTQDALLWVFPQPEKNPCQLKWDDLIDAIRQDKPYNEAKRGAEASLVASMGRMTGFDDALNCKHEFAPDVDKFTMEAASPLQLNPDGRYPVLQPGVIAAREY